MPEHGFACPLLAQIADELRSNLSGHSGPAPAASAMGLQVRQQAQRASTSMPISPPSTVNFWITPADANLDPESGGLVVWDVPAPMDWGFAKFNDDVPAPGIFLARSGGVR